MLCCGRTDIGMKRTVNQDSFICDTFANGMQLAVVCDGMGGIAGGGLASSIACGVFSDAMGDFAADFGTRDTLSHSDERAIKSALLSAIDAANAAVYKRSAEEDLQGMGTTLVATLCYLGVLFTVNVGDSRMYLITGGVPVQVTHDHSYVQYLVDIGRMTEEEARKSVNRNIITRAVGTDDSVEADIFVSRLAGKNISEKIDNSIDLPTHVALLCSDGLTNHVSPEEIVEATRGISAIETDRELGRFAEKLIEMANEKGGTDNITAVLMIP